MKRIFTKNRLVILALSVMIGVAGYLNFNESRQKEDTSREDAQGKRADMEVISYEDEPFATTDNAALEDATSNQLDNLEEPKTDQQASLDQEVELNSDEEDIGKAVMTNAEVMQNNMATAKLNREQDRSRSKEALLEIISDESIDQSARDEAVASYVKLSDTIEKESDTETLLTAKGYADAIVTISDTSVDVALPVDSLSDTDRAQVEDIVTRKTGYDISQVVISVSPGK